MNLYLSIPFLFIKFWFFDAPVRLITYFLSLNHAALEFFSLPLMLRTFFVPLKNEYRKGLVVFSIVTGVIIKTFLILFDTVLMLVLIVFEAGLVFLFTAWPILTFIFLFK